MGEFLDSGALEDSRTLSLTSLPLIVMLDPKTGDH